MAERALWLFGDQVGFARDTRRPVLLVESRAALRRKRYHRQKLHLVLSAMRHLADDLGERATYLRTDTYREALEQHGEPVDVHEPGSHAAEAMVRRFQREGLVAEVLPTKSFALSKEDFQAWAGDRGRFRMEDFYRDQRTRFGILMDGDAPAGGTWNLDADNREPPPKNGDLGVPRPYRPREDAVDERVRADLDNYDLDTVGEDGPRLFPVTRQEALRALQRFLDTRLTRFGPYEDAILEGDWAMSHSLLSVPLNLGLLHPLELVQAAEERYRSGDAPLNSVEGFIRQVIGWREYTWHLYWHHGRAYLRKNHLRAHTHLPDWWAELEHEPVTAACLSTALRGVRERGWVHHIQRLMILGNHALQRGYHPAELTDWFATAFVDGFPWVMPVNVIGMSQHADGGLIATKPYASGGAYIDRMSDHCAGCAFDPRKRLGDDACPYTAGYWAFLKQNADALAGNHRMSRPLASARRLSDLDAVWEQETAREQF
ncbi:cryptochrome/photolyase family protein [Actinokineospora bangkokensis]|uniref:Cryptochrome/photolyase family protein n=1 Tax=Actinokineospora bangkokensis TaxID=1193682 RepID=A0A1Q9LH20_9PSEU|nr:cryptochrome/photolyase family protein [Actinokineospora bangkokensis]OLR91341.1 cryptochrome/photolyase family protein [Actinokineospora bangkokensis]